MLRRIACDEVTTGMFIHGFGGSWFDHPFWRGKFLLETAADVERVRRANVPFVEIDDSLGLAPQTPVSDAGSALGTDYRGGAPTNVQEQRRATSRPRPAPPRADPKRQRAARLLNQSKEVMRGVFEDARLGTAIHFPSMVGVVEDIVAALAAESQVFLAVVRLKSKDDYTYLHSVAVCALMVCAGRYLEKDPEEINGLGMAGLLHDVGKMAIPDQILNKPDALTDDEYRNVRTHPEKGHELLKCSSGIPEAALDVCLHHHEKMDGSGYPFGLAANALSFAARLGAICDVYDALTSNRAYKKAWPPHKALLRMSGWQGHFDPEILAVLMQAIEIYPSDLLVRMRNGKLGLILGNEAAHQTPRAISFTLGNDGSASDLQMLELGRQEGEETFTKIEQPETHAIANWEEFRGELRSRI